MTEIPTINMTLTETPVEADIIELPYTITHPSWEEISNSREWKETGAYGRWPENQSHWE